MGASLCAGRQAFPDEHEGHPAYVQNAVYGQQSYANHASADVRQKPLGGRDSSYAASRFESGQSRRADAGRNARPRGEERQPRANRDLRVDIPPSIPANLTAPPSASTPQTPAEDDYFNSVDEAPVFHTNGDSVDDLQRMIEGVGPPQDTLEPIRWAKGQLIGAGAFGRVYMGMNLDSGELLAVKQVLLATNNTSKEKIQEHLKGLEAEVAVLRNLSHPNIVRYLGTDREEECLNIFLEFVPGGSIASLLSKFGSFKETVIRRYTCQLLLGLEYLHNHQIMHRDIKGANILVDNKGVIKLADFGASKKLADLATMSEGFRSMKGTPYWMAPEVIKQTGHGRQADIWSVGCTVIEMATGKPPWSQFSSGVSALFHIASSKGPPPIPENLSADGRDFLLKCFRRDPKERPSATELLKHPFIAEAGLERSSISPSLASSTFLPSVPSQHTPVLTSGTVMNAGARTPTYAPAWNKRPTTPPTAPIPPSTSYDDDSMRQGSVVTSLPPQSLNRNQASLVYENQLRPIGEDQSASRGEYSPGESGGGTRDGESFRKEGRQNGHGSEDEEAAARGMVEFPTGLGVGDYNNLSMMNSFNPMEEPTIAGDVNIVHWDNSLSEDENLVSAEDRRRLAGGPVSNEGTPGASASDADPPKSRAHSRQSSRDREEERKTVRSKAEEGYVNWEERGAEGYRSKTGRSDENDEGKAGRLDEGYRSKSGRLDEGRAGKVEEGYGGKAGRMEEGLAGKGGKLEEGYGAKSGRLDEGYGAKSGRLEEGSGAKGARLEKEDLGTEEVVNEDTIMAFLDEQARKFKELIVPLEEQANSSLRYSDASDERSGEETDGYGETSVQQEAYSGSPSREDDSYAPPDEGGRNGYPDASGGEFYGRGNNGYGQADSYSSPRGNGYSPQPADPYASPRVNGYPPDPYRESYDAPPRSFRGTPRGAETFARTPVPRVPETEPRSRANVGGGGPIPAEGGPSPLTARARGARSFRESGSGGTSGSSGARSARDGSDVSVAPAGVKRATSFIESGASRPDLDLGRLPQPFLTESLKDVPLSKEEQWKQELARELDSVRVKDHYRRSVARQSDDRGSPMSYAGSPYGTRDSSFMRQSSRLGLQPVIPR